MRPPGRGRVRIRDDVGGVWIVTGLVVGAVVYAGMVAMLVAGFNPVAPLVVIPPVLIALIGANSLLGGGRSHGRSSSGRPDSRDRAPLSSGSAHGTLKVDPVPAAAEEPGELR